MPLGRCIKCGDKLKFGSATCKRCGAKKPRAKYILIAVVAVQTVIIAYYLHYGLPHSNAMPLVVSSPSGGLPLSVAGADGKPQKGWLYFDTRDELIGDVTHHARVVSRSNSPPSQSDPKVIEGFMEIRASPTYGRSALVILHLQSSDEIADNVELHVQFDQGDVVVYHAIGSADAANLTFVVQNSEDFTARLKTSHVVSLEALLPKNHQRVAIFDVAGLTWK